MGGDGDARGLGKHDGTCDDPGKEEGQSTLEYLLVTLGIIVVVVALGAIVRLGADGRLTRLAGAAASHALGAQAGNALLDIFMY